VGLPVGISDAPDSSLTSQSQKMATLIQIYSATKHTAPIDHTAVENVGIVAGVPMVWLPIFNLTV
jgi:hypothetical protein